MDLNQNTRNDFRQKWANMELILNRYQDADAEELVMGYFLIYSLAENMKHKLRHHIDQKLTRTLPILGNPNQIFSNMMGTNQNFPGRINPPQVVIPNRLVTNQELTGRAIGGLTIPGYQAQRTEWVQGHRCIVK